MEENRITAEGPLHNGDGTLANPGYATSLLLHYNRLRIRAPKHRIKEWDYYLINDDEYAVALTLGDLGYMGLISASVIDFGNRSYKTTSSLAAFPMGRYRMPETSARGVSAYSSARVDMRFEVGEGVRKLHARFKRFDGDEDLTVDAVLDEEPRDSMVIATPWAEDPLAFYYNQKIIAMRAQGGFKKGQLAHAFNPENSFGLLDWGRGVWTRDNTWFWAAAQGWQDGEGHAVVGGYRVGLNLGYGFGDTSAASENMVFIDGIAHKLGRVDLGIPLKEGGDGLSKKSVGDKYDLMEPWRVLDEEGKLDLVFTPIIDRQDLTDVKLVVSDQHQVFGTFSGWVHVDNKDFLIGGLNGSAEVVRNKY